MDPQHWQKNYTEIRCRWPLHELLALGSYEALWAFRAQSKMHLKSHWPHCTSLQPIKLPDRTGTWASRAQISICAASSSSESTSSALAPENEPRTRPVKGCSPCISHLVSALGLYARACLLCLSFLSSSIWSRTRGRRLQAILKLRVLSQAGWAEGLDNFKGFPRSFDCLIRVSSTFSPYSRSMTFSACESWDCPIL